MPRPDAARGGHFGRLDILVNNAGMAIRKQPEDYTPAEWHEVVDVNLTSRLRVRQAAYPHMVKHGGGKIINIGSMLSIFGASFAVAYGASKGGIVQMTKGLAVAWAKDNIQVNAILPGWIDTDLTRSARQQVAGLNERVLAARRRRAGAHPRTSPVSPCSSQPRLDFITGAAIPVDGRLFVAELARFKIRSWKGRAR